MSIKKNLWILFSGLLIVILFACSKSTGNSELISENTSENSIEENAEEPAGEDLATSKEENGVIQITQGLLEDSSEKEVNKEAYNIEDSTADAINDEENANGSEKEAPSINKGIVNSSTNKLNQSDKGESLGGKTDTDDQIQVKISETSDNLINEENAIQITVEVPEPRTVDAYDPTLYPG